MLITDPINILNHQTPYGIPVILAKYVPTMRVRVAVAIEHPRNSLRLQLRIFQANTLAMRFAREPNVMSTKMLGIGLIIFDTTQPRVTPTTAGHPYNIDIGIKASATRTWIN